MLLTNFQLLLQDPAAFVILLAVVAISLIIAISVHEFSHAFTAYTLGDATAAKLGRLTLNPLAHLDPAGSIMVLVAGFGWGKPVPVNPYQLRFGRRGMALVSFAGPLSNVLLAVLFGLLFQAGLVTPVGISVSPLRSLDPSAWFAVIATYGVLLNLILAAFNLLPIPPLDGGGILSGIVPRGWLPAVAKLQAIGPVILVLLVLSSFMSNSSVFSDLFSPVYHVADLLLYR